MLFKVNMGAAKKSMIVSANKLHWLQVTMMRAKWSTDMDFCEWEYETERLGEKVLSIVL